jgi:ACS family tartrate transporter-like MFS transporter
VVLGIATLFYLTDRPEDAKWLPDDERDWLKGELAKSGQKVSHRQSGSIWTGLSNPRVLLLTAAYFTLMSGNYGLMMWLPKILKNLSGATNLVVTVMTAIPFLVAVPVSLMVGFHSDSTGERKWHGSLAALAAALGLAVLPLSPAMAVTIGMFAVAAAGNASAKAPFWAIATSVLSGKAKAASIGLINSLGNLGGFVGPYVVGYLTTRTSTYASGLVYLSCCFLCAACLIFYAGWSARRAVQMAAARAQG